MLKHYVTLVAYNYAYLGFEKQARKYGALAVQAAVIEQGPDANDVTALRVFANSVTEHYSWQRKVKKKAGLGWGLAREMGRLGSRWEGGRVRLVN